METENPSVISSIIGVFPLKYCVKSVLANKIYFAQSRSRACSKRTEKFEAARAHGTGMYVHRYMRSGKVSIRAKFEVSFLPDFLNILFYEEKDNLIPSKHEENG